MREGFELSLLVSREWFQNLVENKNNKLLKNKGKLLNTYVNSFNVSVGLPHCFAWQPYFFN